MPNDREVVGLGVDAARAATDLGAAADARRTRQPVDRDPPALVV
jgi:hypothetical protein